MTRDELRSALMDWLESERGRYLALANSLGIPSSVTIADSVATRITDTSTQCTERERFVSPLRTFMEGTRLTFAEHQMGGAPPPPGVLYEHYGGRCRVWMGLPLDQNGDPDDVARSVATQLLSRTSDQYLLQLEALDRPNAVLAGSFVDGLLELVETDRVRFVTALPIAGLRLETEQLEFDGVTIRRLTNEEIGSMFGPLQYTRQPYDQPLTGSFLERFTRRVHLERHALIVRTEHPKTQQPQSNRAHAVVLALQLLGFNLRGRSVAATYTEPGPPLWTGGQRIPLGDFGGDIRDLTAEDLRRAVELSARLPGETFTGPESRKGIAFHRFRSAVCEKFPGDALLDFVIALEALLLTGNDELSFRLALYGARYLEDDPAQRRRVFDDLRKLYSTRSKLVHGGMGLADVRQLETFRASARDLTGRLLVKALREGWPTPQQLEGLSLGLTDSPVLPQP